MIEYNFRKTYKDDATDEDDPNARVSVDGKDNNLNVFFNFNVILVFTI